MRPSHISPRAASRRPSGPAPSRDLTQVFFRSSRGLFLGPTPNMGPCNSPPSHHPLKIFQLFVLLPLEMMAFDPQHTGIKCKMVLLIAALPLPSPLSLLIYLRFPSPQTPPPLPPLSYEHETFFPARHSRAVSLWVNAPYQLSIRTSASIGPTLSFMRRLVRD